MTLNGTIDQGNDMQNYRQAATSMKNPGQRWFDSEISGFSFPREDTFVEQREGLTTKGLRLGTSEMDDRTRLENPDRSLQQFIFPEREEDYQEDDR
jgi:hypothetical protein